MVSQISRQIKRSSRQLPLAPHQMRALRIIAEGDVRPARLAEQLQITPRAVTDVVDALTAEGLVATAPDPADRRAKIVTATDAGISHLEATRQARARISQRMFGALSPAEQEELYTLLSRVLEDSP